MLVLRVESGAQALPVRLEDGLTVLVGRASQCDVVIDHESVSRRHAKIAVEGGRVSILSLSRDNPVFVNGHAVGEAPIAAGDRLRFGRIEAVVESAGGGAAAGPASPTTSLRADALAAGKALEVDAARVIRLLGEVARTLAAPLPLDAVLDRVVALVAAHVPAERTMLLMRAAGGDFVPAIVRDGDAPTPFAVSRTVIDLVVRDRAAVLTADVRDDARFGDADSLSGAAIRSLMCAPLVAEGSVIGLLYVDNTWEHQFSRADLELFTALADSASVAVAQARLADGLRREARRRERLSRYHSPAVVDRVLADDRTTGVAAVQARDVTIVFADIVKFTTLSEGMPAADVVQILNAFFRRMTEIAFAHDGTVDKFIGDAILVVFGAPLAQSDHASRALQTALEMQTAVEELNARGVAPRPLQIRVAVHSGPAVAGDIGSAERLEYTVIGDVVNTAARLQSDVAGPGEVVLTSATLERVGGTVPVEAMGAVTIRGRAGMIDVFRLVLQGGVPPSA